MTVLVVGATGATGRHLVDQLLFGGAKVHVVVRDAGRLPEMLRGRENLTASEASISDMEDEDLRRITEGCDAVASCLGHNLTARGIWGKPRKLVTDAVRRLCAAVEAGKPNKPVRFVLMNTTGNRNRDLDEPATVGYRVVMGLMRVLLPPQRDNEAAAEQLRAVIGPDHPSLEWVVVRPDTLIDEIDVSPYDLHPSPIRSPVFDPGKTSRINVGHFMADLATNRETWDRWKGQMPVIYNTIG